MKCTKIDKNCKQDTKYNENVCTAIKQARKFKTSNEIAIKKKKAEMSADRNFKNMLLVNSEKTSKLPAASTCYIT